MKNIYSIQQIIDYWSKNGNFNIDLYLKFLKTIKE